MSNEEAPRRPTLREELRNVTRARLLVAAEETIAARGYIAATIDDIADAAGVSRATFYLHFPNKQTILSELTAAYLPTYKEFYRRLDAVLVSGSRQELRLWMHDAVTWLQEHQAQMFAYEEASVTDVSFVADQTRVVIGIVVEEMPGYLASWPAERRDEARLRVALLIVQLDPALRHLLVWRSWPADLAEVVDLLCDQWSNALGWPAATPREGRSDVVAP